jgi:hypothetical protein
LSAVGCDGSRPQASPFTVAGAPFPDCPSLVSRLPADALGNPALRFSGPADTDNPPGPTLFCPLIGMAVDGRTALQVQIWLSRPAVNPGNGQSPAQALGETAKAQAGKYCAPNTPETSGDPITNIRCYGPTVEGAVAGLAIVRGSVIIGVRIDAIGAGQAGDGFPQKVQAQEQRIADVVAATL